MEKQRRVRLFTDGHNQAVWIPEDFALPTEDVIMRKEGDRIVIEPVAPRSFSAVLAGMQPIEEEFPPIEDLPLDPVDL